MPTRNDHPEITSIIAAVAAALMVVVLEYQGKEMVVEPMMVEDKSSNVKHTCPHKFESSMDDLS